MYARVYLFSSVVAVVLHVSLAQAQSKDVITSVKDSTGDSLPAGATVRLGTTRWRHAGSVRALAIDGDQIVSVANDDWTCRWDAKSGKRLTSFRSPILHLGAAVTSGLVVLSPDGKRVATVARTDGESDALVIWDTATGKIVSEVKGQRLLGQLSEGCLAFSFDGAQMVIGNLNGELHLLEIGKGKKLTRFGEKEEQPTRVAFSRDGRHIARVERQRIVVLDKTTGKTRQILEVKVENDALAAVAFSPDGKTLVSGTEGGVIHAWDLETSKRRYVLRDKNRRQPLSFLFLEFSPDGKTIAIGDVYNTSVLLCNATNGQVVHDLADVYGARCAAFSADGKTLFTGDSGHLIRAWDVKTGKEKNPPGKFDIVRSPIALSADGKQLAVSSSEGVQIVSFPEGTLQRGLGRDVQPSCIAFAPKDRTLATGSSDGYVRFYDLSTGKETRKVLAHFYDDDAKIEPRPVAALAFSPDGARLATGGSDSRVCLWDAKTGKRLYEWKDRRGWVHAVAFSPDGKLVAAGGCSSDSMTTCLWNPENGKLIQKLEDSPAQTLAFSRDGAVLATAGGLFGGWWMTFTDPKTGKATKVADSAKRSEPDQFHAAAVSPDGQLLAFGSARGIFLWDIKARKELRQIRGEFGGCIDLVFAADSRTLIAAHYNGTVLFWDVTKLRLK